MLDTAAAPIALYLPENLRIIVPPQISCLTTYVLLEQEDWLEDEISFVRSHLHEGMNVIDVGANLGVYTLTAAQCVGKTGHVWAIEPGHFACYHLRQSIASNSFQNITLFQGALSDHCGEAFLAHGVTDELNKISTEYANDASGEMVPLTTLDTLQATAQLPKIDFVKLDAEGHEIPIIMGAGNFLDSNKPLFMIEVLDKKVELGAIRVLLDLGYLLFRLVPGIGVLVPTTYQELEFLRHLNAFALHPDAVSKWQQQGAIVENIHIQPEFDISVLIDYWEQQEWAKPYIATWQSWGQSNDQNQQYMRALVLLLQSENRDSDTGLRYSCLIEAKRLLEDFAAENNTPAVDLFMIRLCIALGNKPSARAHCFKFYDFQASGNKLTTEMPLIAPAESFSGHAIDEVMCMTVLRLINRLMHPSTIYHADYSKQVGAAIRQHASSTLEDERRFLLSTAFANKQVPKDWNASASLQAKSPNASVWRNQEKLFI